MFFFVFFLIDGVIEDPNTTINGPPLARQRNAIKMAFRWRADAGLVACDFSRDSDQYCKEILQFCDFSGWEEWGGGRNCVFFPS